MVQTDTIEEDGYSNMSQAIIKRAIAEKKMLCPQCQKPVKEFEKLVEMTDSVWDGAGDSNLETKGVKVTLICGNPPCDWRERTEYWSNYISD
jgi:hypothetical protein